LDLLKEWSEGLLSSRDVRLLASADGLANLEALELGMAEVEGLVLSGPLVGGPKCPSDRVQASNAVRLSHTVWEA
jgi:hypothetical protein